MLANHHSASRSVMLCWRTAPRASNIEAELEYGVNQLLSNPAVRIVRLSGL